MPVQITPEAQAEVNKLPAEIKDRVRHIVDRLQFWPNVSGAKALQYEWVGHFRIRTGAYRVVFRVRGTEVTIVKVDDRQDVYKGKRSSRSPTGKLLNAEVFLAQGIARDLKLARLDAGLTQMQLATKIGVSQAMVAGVETGRIRVGQKYIHKLLKVCGQPRDYPQHRRIVAVGTRRAASPRR